MRIAMLVGTAVAGVALNAQAVPLDLEAEAEGQESVIAALEPSESIRLDTPTIQDDRAQGISCEPDCFLPGYYFPPPTSPPVSEPTAAVLLGLGLASLGLIRRPRGGGR